MQSIPLKKLTVSHDTKLYTIYHHAAKKQINNSHRRHIRSYCW